MSTTPGSHDFNLYKYATFEQSLTWKNSSGVPIDLSGYSAHLTVKDLEAGVTVLDLDSTAPNGIVLGGSMGTIELSLDASDTVDLSPGGYAYDLLMTSEYGTKTRLLSGAFNIIDGITTT